MSGPEHAQGGGAVVQTLRERLNLAAGGYFDLPAPPALPEGAGEGALRVRGFKMGRALLAAGDSFLHAAAPQMGVLASGVDAYCAAQRAAVVSALALCSPRSVDAALGALAGSSDSWARSMLLPATPFDALALMLWSLVSDRCVWVLGHEVAADTEFNACSAQDCVAVGRLRTGEWAGFDEYRRQGVSCVLPPPCLKRARGDAELPPAQRLRRDGDSGAFALPVAERDLAREGLLAEQGRLNARLLELKAELERGRSTCFYIVRHPVDALKASRFFKQLCHVQRALISVDHWVVVGFGRTDYALQAYSNGQGRVYGEYFSPAVEEGVYAFRRSDVMVWQQDADGAAAYLERLLKAVLAFTLHGHEPASELRDFLQDQKSVLAFSHPACCVIKLDGWVNETLLMHPDLWAKLQTNSLSAPHPLLNGGRVLTCDAQTLQDALLPPVVRQRHSALNPVWAKAHQSGVGSAGSAAAAQTAVTAAQAAI